MNNLSIIIYFADVVPKLGTLFAILSTLSVFVIVVSSIAYLQKRSEFRISVREGAGYEKHAHDEKSMMDFWIKVFRLALVIFSLRYALLFYTALFHPVNLFSSHQRYPSLFLLQCAYRL